MLCEGILIISLFFLVVVDKKVNKYIFVLLIHNYIYSPFFYNELVTCYSVRLTY